MKLRESLIKSVKLSLTVLDVGAAQAKPTKVIKSGVLPRIVHSKNHTSLNSQ